MLFLQELPPPQDSSHHQVYYFLVGNPYKPCICHCYWVGWNNSIYIRSPWRSNGLRVYCLRLSAEEGDGVIERLFQRVQGLFDLEAQGRIHGLGLLCWVGDPFCWAQVGWGELSKYKLWKKGIGFCKRIQKCLNTHYYFWSFVQWSFATAGVFGIDC